MAITQKTTLTLNPSPKTRFQRDEAALSKHRDFLTSEEFQHAMDGALLQLQAELTMTIKDQYGAMAVGLRLLGAQELIQKVWDLASMTERPPVRITDNLNHSL